MVHRAHRLKNAERDDIFEGSNTVPHENVSVRKIHLQKTLEFAEISWRIPELRESTINSKKECIVIEKIVGKSFPLKI